MKANIIGRIPKKTLTKINLRHSRRVISRGVLLGSAIVTGIKSIPDVSWARCDIRVNKKGLFAARGGIFVMPVSSKIVNDSSFKSL